MFRQHREVIEVGDRGEQLQLWCWLREREREGDWDEEYNREGT